MVPGAYRDTKVSALVGGTVGTVSVDPSRVGSFTVSMIDIAGRAVIADVPVAGRTRWTIFDPETDCFYVNIADPPQIAVIEPRAPAKVARSFSVSAVGSHGLDLDPAGRRLFCACDGKRVIALESRTGAVTDDIEIAGVPGVVFCNPRHGGSVRNFTLPRVAVAPSLPPSP